MTKDDHTDDDRLSPHAKVNQLINVQNRGGSGEVKESNYLGGNMNESGGWDNDSLGASFSSSECSVLDELQLLEEPMELDLIQGAYEDLGFWLPLPTDGSNLTSFLSDKSRGDVSVGRTILPGNVAVRMGTVDALETTFSPSVSYCETIDKATVSPPLGKAHPMMWPKELEPREIRNASTMVDAFHANSSHGFNYISTTESFQAPTTNPDEYFVWWAKRECTPAQPNQALPGAFHSNNRGGLASPPTNCVGRRPSNFAYAGILTTPYPMVSLASGPSTQGIWAFQCSELPMSAEENAPRTISFSTLTSNSNGWWTMRHVTPPPPPSPTLTSYDVPQTPRFACCDDDMAHSMVSTGVDLSSPRGEDLVHRAPDTDSEVECKASDAKPVTIQAKTVPRKSVCSNRRKQGVKGGGPPDPAKPLTAYNLFFKFERDRLLKYCASNPTVTEAELLALEDLPAEYNKHYEWTLENSVDFQTKFMQEHWRCGKTKRPHRKSHGRIAFTSLTKFIAASWNKRLPEST
jgi:hypothetical protein